jgi:hypothetical protein
MFYVDFQKLSPFMENYLVLLEKFRKVLCYWSLSVGCLLSLDHKGRNPDMIPWYIVKAHFRMCNTIIKFVERRLRQSEVFYEPKD